MTVELDLSEYHESMLEELRGLEDADADAELTAQVEGLIHDAYQHHRGQGNLDG